MQKNLYRNQFTSRDFSSGQLTANGAKGSFLRKAFSNNFFELMEREKSGSRILKMLAEQSCTIAISNTFLGSIFAVDFAFLLRETGKLPPALVFSSFLVHF